MIKPIIFSGIQPSGNLHVGNYLGAVKNWVDLQNSGQYDCFFCIVDYHSLSGNMTAEERRENTTTLAAELLALGIDPNKSTLFIQSAVPECAELAWIFNTITPVVELERMTQFKDKSKQQAKNINAGLFTYPLLQPADILLYHGQFVPVGQDQAQHIELTRNIARWFNKRYTEYFPEPKPLLTAAPKVMSILEPDKKMSKSLGEGQVLDLVDEPKVIAKKLKKAVTATVGGKKSPGVENLLLLLKHFGEAQTYQQFMAAEKVGKIQYGELKETLADSLARYFVEFRARRAELLSDQDVLAAQLAAGAKKARALAEKTMRQTRRLVGIG